MMKYNHQYITMKFGSHVRACATMLVFACLALTSFSAVSAAGVVAGTDISNVATATYNISGTPVSIDSSLNIFRVDELLDVLVENQDAGPVTTSPNVVDNVQRFRVTNIGNGTETFALSVDANLPGDDFDPLAPRIYIDNGNGVFDQGVDILYVPGSNDPTLGPDENIIIFILSNTPGTVNDNDVSDVELTATSTTIIGTPVPGQSFNGAGDTGVDAVVGTSGATGSDTGRLIIAATSLSFVKSATILDPDGGTMPVPGAVITYILVLTTTGTGVLPNLIITDPIPAGSIYVANSITLDGTPLTDVADADIGEFDGSQIIVTVGDVPAGETRTVTFQVTIQ